MWLGDSYPGVVPCMLSLAFCEFKYIARLFCPVGNLDLP
jgi:hypothetical protein